MRGGYTLSLIIAVLFAGGYFYYIAEAICPQPLPYRLGVLDERFGLNDEEAKLAIAGAEGVWERATGRNLFTYDEGADFAVNFIFDDRQAFADAEEDYKSRLDRAEWANESIMHQYEDLVSQYDSSKASYEQAVATYDVNLAAYNRKVASYNETGGAPPEVFAELEATKAELAEQQVSLNARATELNGLVEQINEVGSEGNRVIETYNRGVDVYNQTFGEPREFTQGDYQGDRINIYTFDSQTELELVLAHELGHALHLGHVEGDTSVMHYLIGGQPDTLNLTESDLREYARVCGSDVASLLERFKIAVGL